MIGSIAEIGKIPELRKKIFFTIAMLAVYRLGVFVATPGIDVEQFRNVFASQAGSLFGLMNMFSGGALEHFSIFTLGIAPYISMSIIFQFLTPVIPALEALRKEGDSGRRILMRYTRQGTIILALIQSFALSQTFQAQGLAKVSGWTFTLSTMLTLTAGTAFIMWLSEQITERGIGNGASLVIFTGIVARMPSVFFSTLELARTGNIAPPMVLFLIGFCVLTIALIVYVERSYRRIPIQHPRRMVGQGLSQAQTQYLPLKLNMAGVYPPILASALLSFFGLFFKFSSSEAWQTINRYLEHGSFGYSLISTFLIVVFSYLATAIVFNPDEVADNLKKNGSFIPTVRPGTPTAEYLNGVITRLTLWGSIYIACVCLIPELIYIQLNAINFASVFGGTAILIVVGVTLDTSSQIETMIVARNYESFMNKNSRARSGAGSMGYMRSRLLKR